MFIHHRKMSNDLHSLLNHLLTFLIIYPILFVQDNVMLHDNYQIYSIIYLLIFHTYMNNIELFYQLKVIIFHSFVLITIQNFYYFYEMSSMEKVTPKSHTVSKNQDINSNNQIMLYDVYVKHFLEI
jgi:hypothetical protein